MVTNTSNTINASHEDIKKISHGELAARLKWAKEVNNPATNTLDDINRYAQEIHERIKNWKISTEELKEYFLNDIKSFKGNSTSEIASQSSYKDKKIADLEKQLMDVTSDLKGSLKEYFSPRRLRLVNMKKRIEELKKDEKDYPKNVLIYCMAMTNTKIFGIREKMKRWWISMLRRRKNDDIKKQLDIMNEKLKENNDDHVSRKLLKNMLRDAVKEAKNKYVEKSKESVWI